MKKAYDFDSDGPGKAGPYQEFSYENIEDEDQDEFMDYDGDDASTWPGANYGDDKDVFEEVDEDLKESFITQKNKIMEMFNRINKYN
jgi:hypothetical protein